MIPRTSTRASASMLDVLLLILRVVKRSEGYEENLIVELRGNSPNIGGDIPDQSTGPRANPKK